MFLLYIEKMRDSKLVLFIGEGTKLMINSVITQPLHMSSLHKCGRAGLNFLDLIKELKAFRKSGLFGTRQVAELKVVSTN